MSNSQPTRWTPESHRWKQSQNKANSNKPLDDEDIYAEEPANLKKPNLGLSGIGNDIIESTLSAPAAGIEALSNLPGHVMSGATYVKKEPWSHTLGQLSIGGAEGLAGLLSSPQVGARYLSEKFGNPEGSVYKNLHQTPTPYELMQDYEKEFGVDASKEGEAEIRGLGQLALARKAPYKTVAATVAGEGGDPIHASIGKYATGNVSKILNKAGDIAPIIKPIATSPYKKQLKILTSKDLLAGYKPNVADINEASRLLKSEGMQIPHEAVNLATEQALKGNYKPWFSLQSTVRTEGRRLSRKGGVHRELGQKLHELSEKMHSDIGKQQAERGAPEAEKLMHQGKERFARYHKISPYARAAAIIGGASLLPKWITDFTKAVK